LCGRFVQWEKLEGKSFEWIGVVNLSWGQIDDIRVVDLVMGPVKEESYRKVVEIVKCHMGLGTH
jgi:hypothetical protein